MLISNIQLTHSRGFRGYVFGAGWSCCYLRRFRGCVFGARWSCCNLRLKSEIRCIALVVHLPYPRLFSEIGKIRRSEYLSSNIGKTAQNSFWVFRDYISGRTFVAWKSTAAKCFGRIFRKREKSVPRTKIFPQLGSGTRPSVLPNFRHRSCWPGSRAADWRDQLGRRPTQT